MEPAVPIVSEGNARLIAKTPACRSRSIDFNNPTDRARRDRMVARVERMLALHKQRAGAKTAHDQTVVQRQIDATDKEIDRLVHELYGLAAAETAIVEGERG